MRIKSVVLGWKMKVVFGVKFKNVVMVGLAVCFAVGNFVCAADDEKAFVSFVEWGFNDTKNPYASKGVANAALVIQGSGRPQFVDGVIGKAVLFSKEGDPFTLIAPKKLNALFTDGKRSFTAECFVKTDSIDYYLFFGNRSVATWYPTRGFALGCIRNGNLGAVIGNGTSRKYSVFNHLKSSWAPGEWNHLAIVRDAKAETVILYLNGKASARLECQTVNRKIDVKTPIDTTSDEPMRIGVDTMTGHRLVGAVDEVRVTARALAPEEIAERTKLIRIGGEAKSLSATLTPVTVADAELARPIDLPIMPRPRSLDLANENVKIARQTWCANGLDDYGIVALSNLLARSCGMAPAAEAGIAFRFEEEKTEHDEGFSAHGERTSDGIYEIVIRSEGHAKYYAMDAVAQILRRASLQSGSVLAAPKSFTMTDWPSMPHRMALSPLDYKLKCSDASIACQGHNTAFMRLNGTHFQIRTSEERLKVLCDTFRAYGVGVMPWFGYLGQKRPLTPLSEEDMMVMKDYFELCGRVGVAGHTVAFDDLNGPYLDIMKRADVKAAYGTMGNLHNALVKKAIEFSKPFAPMRWQVIPFCYCARDVRSDYFRDFCKDFDTLDVTTLHTTFTAREIDALHESGVKKYGYYVNGNWPTKLFFNWYMGPECMAWTWNLFYIDRNGVGPVGYIDRLNEICHLHERSDVIFGASGSPRGRHIAGWFGWNPAAWDEELAARALTQHYYGSGVHEPLMWYARLVGPMVGVFMAYKTGWTSEAKAPETTRLAPLSKHEIMGYFRNLAKAERAADLVETAIANQKTAFDRPQSTWGTKEEQKRLVADMRNSLSEMRAKLESLAEKYGVDTMLCR